MYLELKDVFVHECSQQSSEFSKATGLKSLGIAPDHKFMPLAWWFRSDSFVLAVYGILQYDFEVGGFLMRVQPVISSSTCAAEWPEPGPTVLFPDVIHRLGLPRTTQFLKCNSEEGVRTAIAEVLLQAKTILSYKHRFEDVFSARQESARKLIKWYKSEKNRRHDTP
jgi:hypothetical protein